jgi:hypothetical protein
MAHLLVYLVLQLVQFLHRPIQIFVRVLLVMKFRQNWILQTRSGKLFLLRQFQGWTRYPTHKVALHQLRAPYLKSVKISGDPALQQLYHLILSSTEVKMAGGAAGA